MIIPPQNIYYMLSYSFQILNENGYRNIATEEFHNVAEMCSSILIKGVSIQLKRGLGKEYVEENDSLSSLKGKIDISASVKTLSIQNRKLVCHYDEFSVNSYMNQILKSTMTLLLRFDITKKRKQEIRKLLVFFDDVDLLDIHTIKWNMQYNRNNQTYRMLISICYLVVKGLLLTEKDGTKKMMDFIDPQNMHRLYERFILEYYRKEHPKIKSNASQIAWQLDDEISDMLPVMQSDIMLTKDNKVLIIDAKYYANTLQSNYNTNTIHSGNLYQIFTYVKNKELEIHDTNSEVSGMLLYAKTDESVLPNNTYKMSGNTISVKTLDLGCEFTQVAKQLDQIAFDYFK